MISARIRGALRAIVCLRLRANGAGDNAKVTRRSHFQKSLLRDNDRAVFRAKLVIILRGLDRAITQVINMK